MLKTYYKNRLPHIVPVGAEFFITFRLSDSLPVAVIQSLKDEMDISIQKLKKEKPKNFKFLINGLKHHFSFKYDYYLDHKPFGHCYLKNEKIAQLVADRMHKFDGKHYTLEAYTIMPNHVHLLIDTSKQTENNDFDIESNYVQLDKIMQLIKGGSAFQANKILERKGTFWMKDSYDHYIRNEKDWENTLEYIINNPVEAGLVDDWKDWKFTYCKYM
jgi:REP element-mobilizing transposase RayT